jgi:hypothetical protein
MHHRKRWARALTSVCLAGGLVVGLAVSASASIVQVSTRVTPGGTLDLLCPNEGEQVLEFGGGYDATVTFYTNVNRNKVVDSFAKGDDRTLSVIAANGRAVGLSYPVPKSAHWAEATLACAVIPVLTAGEPTCNPDGSASIPYAITNPDPEWTVVVDLDYIIGSSVNDATVVELAPGESTEGSVTVPPEQTSAGQEVSLLVTMSYPDGSNLQYAINPVVLSDCTPAQV